MYSILKNCAFLWPRRNHIVQNKQTNSAHTLFSNMQLLLCTRYAQPQNHVSLLLNMSRGFMQRLGVSFIHSLLSCACLDWMNLMSLSYVGHCNKIIVSFICIDIGQYSVAEFGWKWLMLKRQTKKCHFAYAKTSESMNDKPYQITRMLAQNAFNFVGEK